MQAFQEARDSLRNNMRAHGSTPNRQQTLAVILNAHGEMYNKQYDHEPGPDKSKCLTARALVEEAVAINRALNSQADELALKLATQPQHPLNQANRQDRTAQVLLTLMRTYIDLDMFDEARHTLKEAMALNISRYGDESEKVALCQSNMSALCGG